MGPGGTIGPAADASASRKTGGLQGKRCYNGPSRTAGSGALCVRNLPANRGNIGFAFKCRLHSGTGCG